MTKVFHSSPTSKIVSINSDNIIEVNKDNIIESDSECREVVKKGYLLNNINLSTIPDIIQDAINQAVLDAKEQTLADAMIETLRLSILNLDDGIYKKTYIDNTITYLENLLVSKASPEIAASIAEAKIAVATAEFATTSQVNTLSSRVVNSETEIQNVKQTINTKDTARALQFEEMEARVNDAFAGYSEAIDLYVDENGNVKSEKIEKLEANNSMATVSINEENKISLDAQGNYVAFVAKFIADSDGKIVGYNFSDTNDLTNFTINADVFKISNSDNSYTPFTIDGSNILFNGKITFANVTGTDGIVTTSNVQTVFNSEVTTIDGGKITTNQALVNNLNAVGGIIADTVTANEFVGKTFTGAVINGARINGAVIKASYLDLDGELEVLTNYHITVAMYNANPSLYTDAVYLSGTNEWRIPSINTVREEIKIQNISNSGSIFNSRIRSYNCANASHNMKCVKIQPNITVSADVDFFDFNFYNKIPDASIGITNTYKLYIASVLVCSICFRAESVITGNTGFYIDGTKRDFSDDIIFNTAGQVIKLSFYNFNTFYNSSEIVSNYNYGIKATIVAGTNTIPLNYNDTSKGLIYIENIGGNTIPSVNNYVQVTSKTNTFISINNMI